MFIGNILAVLCIIAIVGFVISVVFYINSINSRVPFWARATALYLIFILFIAGFLLFFAYLISKYAAPTARQVPNVESYRILYKEQSEEVPGLTAFVVEKDGETCTFSATEDELYFDADVKFLGQEPNFLIIITYPYTEGSSIFIRPATERVEYHLSLKPT